MVEADGDDAVLLYGTGITTPAQAFGRLHQLIARLRGPGGCPWDREQDHLSLRTHLLEEACEAMEAIEGGDDLDLIEELGDLMMQPVLHAQIAAETQRFDVVRVLQQLCDKLIRRHPHVFGEVEVADSSDVLRNWEAIKQEEKRVRGKPAPTSILDGVPMALPALALAAQVSKKAARAGFEWPDLPGVLEKLHEEIGELEETLTHPEPARSDRFAEEIGDLLFTVVNVARWQKVDPELALRDTVARFRQRFALMESAAQARGQALADLSLEEWDQLWESAKHHLDPH